MLPRFPSADVTRELSIETPTHGRVLVEDAQEGRPAGLLVTFHGYGQNADDALAAARAIPGADRWRIAAPQALHRFYTKGDRTVVASWMTRQDRAAAIADNVAYVDRALDALGLDAGLPLVLLGFSQGASMAYRAAIFGRHHAAGVVALAGDIPPEVREAAPRPWPRVLIGCGDEDVWYSARVESDVAFLKSRGLSFELVRFAAGHAFTPEFSGRVGQWLQTLHSPTPM